MLARARRLETTAHPRTSRAMTASVGSFTAPHPPIAVDGVRRVPLVEPRFRRPCGLRPMRVSAAAAGEVVLIVTFHPKRCRVRLPSLGLEGWVSHVHTR